MVKARVLSAVGIVAVVGGIAAVAAQTPASPAFEVVSIKPAPAESHTGYRPLPGGRLTGTFSLHSLIGLAYHSVNPDLRLDQIVGEPSWAASLFSITATVGPGGPTDLAAFSKALSPMLKTLLEDRFKLAAHVEKREVPVYALVVARSDGRLGPKLRPITDDECAARRLKATSGALDPSRDARPCGGSLYPANGVSAFGVSMERVASLLQGGAPGRPILDRTNLAGVFDMDKRVILHLRLGTAAADSSRLRKIQENRGRLSARHAVRGLPGTACNFLQGNSS
jgi:bla regulator protein blaR1